MSTCNSFTNFSQNLRIKPNNARLSNWHGKRYVHKQTLATKIKFFKFIGDIAESNFTTFFAHYALFSLL